MQKMYTAEDRERQLKDLALFLEEFIKFLEVNKNIEAPIITYQSCLVEKKINER